MRSWSRRGSTLLLAVVFVVGHLGLATADGLAFHGVGARLGQTRPHYEPAGTTCGHADRCVLGAPLPDPRLPPFLSADAAASTVVPVVEPDFVVSQPAASRPPLPQPRGPPAASRAS